MTSFNPHLPSVKRILKELSELHSSPSPFFLLSLLDDNLFELHFTLFFPLSSSSDFAGGRYHGRMFLPTEYPFKAPDIMFYTPNGRFEVGKKICLSVTAFHQESWSPSWNVRTMLEALMAFMPQKGNGGIGALEYSREERQRLAKESWMFVCPHCKQVIAEMEMLVGDKNESVCELPVSLLGASSSFQVSSTSSISGVSSPVVSGVNTSTSASAALLSPESLSGDVSSEMKEVSESTTSASSAFSTSSTSASDFEPTTPPHSTLPTAAPVAIETGTSGFDDTLLSLLTVLVFTLLVILLIRKFAGFDRF